MRKTYPLHILVIETIVLLVLNSALLALFTAWKVPLVGVDVTQSTNFPFAFIVSTLLFTVLLEELVFRLIPFKVWSRFFKSPVSFWVMGCITSFLFAALHMSADSVDVLPFTQFFSGLYWWHLIRQHRGFRLVLISHLLTNGILLAFLLVIGS